MYGNFVLFDDAGKLEKGEQVYLGEMRGKNEAWLRDMNRPGIAGGYLV